MSTPDADEQLRQAVARLAARQDCDWAGIYFVEGDQLVLGPEAGTPDPARRTSVPVSWRDTRVAELAADGAVAQSDLEELAAASLDTIVSISVRDWADDFPDDMRIGVEGSAPQAFGEDDGHRSAGQAFGVAEPAAEKRLHAEHREQVGGDVGGDDALRGVPGLEHADVFVVSGYRLEQARLGLDVGVVEPRCGVEAGLVAHHADGYQAACMRVRQRAQQDGFNDSEDCGVGSNSEGEGEDGEEGHPAGRAKLPEGGAEVVADGLH